MVGQLGTYWYIYMRIMILFHQSLEIRRVKFKFAGDHRTSNISTKKLEAPTEAGGGISVRTSVPGVQCTVDRHRPPCEE